MKTFTATDARNRFGEFLDAGMVEGVKLVRNNRTLGYFLPERQYEEWAQFARSPSVSPKKTTAKLSAGQLETLAAFCAGRITGSEARAELHCDRRALIEFVAIQGLTLPHISHSRAVEMAQQALGTMGTHRAVKGGALG
jgi:hypothetical protein